MKDVVFRPIGVARTPFVETEGTPIQSIGARDVEGTIEVLPEFREGLADLDGFSHIIVVFHFHRSAGFSLLTRPFLEETLRGVFATRSPRRPNGIGISVVRLLGIEDGTLRIRSVDMLDETPVLDIKPYIPRADSRPVDSIGWLEGRSHEYRTFRVGQGPIPGDTGQEDIPIREFDIADHDAVIALWEREGAEHKPMGRDRKETIERELGLPTSIFLVAEIDGGIVGTVFGTHDGRKGWINRLVVASGFRRRNIATRLVGEVERRLADRGIDIVGVLIWDTNDVSIEVFESLGYERADDCLYFSKRKGPEV